MLLGRSTSLLKVTQVSDIPFLPLDIVISNRYPELWLPYGDHRSICLRGQSHSEDDGLKDGKKLGSICSLAVLPLDFLLFEKINAFIS